MGSGTWSANVYASTTGATLRSGGDTFQYNASLRTRPRAEWKAHETLDPHTALREARDSDEHPHSTPITVLFDVTGSMHNTPRILQEKLPNLFGLIQRKGYIEDAQVMVGAIGDANSDRVPLQISQWESDNRIDEALGNLVLEGGGGGQAMETYELALYFMARKTVTDSLEKRGKKPYLFLIGDEKAYPKVRADQVNALMAIEGGTEISEDIPLEDIVAEVTDKYEVFFLFPEQGVSYPADGPHYDFWNRLFPERVLRMADPADVCEVVAMTIGVHEGVIDVDTGIDHLKDLGVDEATIKSASTAVATLTGSGTVDKVRVDGDLPAAKVDAATERL